MTCSEIAKIRNYSQEDYEIQCKEARDLMLLIDRK